jgi:hypothetical protein
MTDGKHQVSHEPLLSNRSYDILKFVVSVLLPGLATFYLGLDQIWNLPYEFQISATITAVATLLGLFMRTASKRYADQPIEYDGELFAVKNGNAPTDLLLSLDSQEQAEEIRQKGQVTFKVIVR